jgi:S-adenosylhomocysteine hydrolase
LYTIAYAYINIYVNHIFPYFQAAKEAILEQQRKLEAKVKAAKEEIGQHEAQQRLKNETVRIEAVTEEKRKSIEQSEQKCFTVRAFGAADCNLQNK